MKKVVKKSSKKVKVKPPKEQKTLYMCGTDWKEEMELGYKFEIFSSVEELKRDKECWDECGIVEIKMEGTWLHPQNYFNNKYKV